MSARKSRRNSLPKTRRNSSVIPVIRPKAMDRAVADTPTGAGFLKCAIAAPDFGAENNAGIPDAFSGKTIVKSHRLASTLTMTTTSDTYILLLPTPGYAIWKADIVAGGAPSATTVWTGTPFADTTTLFPVSNPSVNLNQFRMVSNIIELQCTSNATQWSGSITCWKFPTTCFVVGQNNQTQNLYQVDGLENCTTPPGMCYTTAQNLGLYAPCYHLTEQFTFNPIINSLFVNRTDTGAYGYLSNQLFGYDPGLEALCIRISASNSSFIIRNWQCVEYQVNISSTLYDYARISAPKDEKALKAYHHFTRSCAIAYNSFQNENMWQRFLAMFIQGTRAASVLPGAYGAVAGGLNAVGTGIQTLLM